MTIADKAQIVRRGKELFDIEIRSRITPADHGKFLAINVESGVYSIDTDELRALKTAANGVPDAPVYLMRIGSPVAHRLGGRVSVRRQ